MVICCIQHKLKAFLKTKYAKFRPLSLVVQTQFDSGVILQIEHQFTVTHFALATPVILTVY